MSTIKWGNSSIKNIYWGSTPVKEVWYGSNKIWSNCPYTPNQVLFESSTPGTYSLNILTDGVYEVYCIAGGSGGAAYHVYGYKWYSASGASGSGYIGNLKITQHTYQIVVGRGSSGKHNSSEKISDAENSSISNVVTSYGGKGGKAVDDRTQAVGGDIPTIFTQEISFTLKQRGNNGTIDDDSDLCSGGASLYNGYGKGGDVNIFDYVNDGTNGYVKIIFKHQ